MSILLLQRRGQMEGTCAVEGPANTHRILGQGFAILNLPYVLHTKFLWFSVVSAYMRNLKSYGYDQRSKTINFLIPYDSNQHSGSSPQRECWEVKKKKTPKNEHETSLFRQISTYYGGRVKNQLAKSFHLKDLWPGCLTAMKMYAQWSSFFHLGPFPSSCCVGPGSSAKCWKPHLPDAISCVPPRSPPENTHSFQVAWPVGSSLAKGQDSYRSSHHWLNGNNGKKGTLL